MTKYELYWAEREQENLLENLMDTDILAAMVADVNNKAYQEVQEQLYAWYGKYADANGITIEEARKAAEEADIKALAKRAKTYVATKDLSPEANAAMAEYNFAMKTSRLELLQNQIRWSYFEATDQQEKILNDLLPKAAVKTLTRQAGIMGKTLYTPAETRRLADYITKTSYQGNTFSERIWTNNQNLMKGELDRILRQGIMQGKNPAAQATALAKLHQRKQSDAERLLRTEGARVRAQARAASFERAGYTHFKWVPRGNPCEYCLEKVKESEEKPYPIKGGLMPPLHPYCYCSTAPVEPEENILSKDAIDADFEKLWQAALDGDADARSHFEKLYQNTSTPDWKQFKLDDAAEKARQEAAAAEAAKPKTTVVQGRDLIGEEIFWDVDHDQEPIEAMIAAQGFNGKPRLVSAAEFERAKNESGFYAKRTYAAPDKATLDEYRRQLYEDKFYVDCGTGGAQYGQGMYCASTYDLKRKTNLTGIDAEMNHYQALGKQRGNKYAYTEELTLTPDAKVFQLSSGSRDASEIRDEYRIRFAEKRASTPTEKEDAAWLRETSEALRKAEVEYNKGYTEAREAAWIKADNERQWAISNFEKSGVGAAYAERMSNYEFNDPGTLAAEMGYDAIRAEGHGKSGSYTVVLNRTKLIIKKGGTDG